MATSTIKHFRGDTWLRSWVIKDASGAPVDLTGASARLHVRPQEGTDNADELILAATVGDGLTITPGTGRVDLRVEAADMAIDPGTYRFELELTDGDGVVRTIEQNRIMIIEDVARD